ncbi:MAG: biopolymer transporter ExbD [Acidobacteriia bacterium]|nr:biopolymer transporter ExbD [Terriglobia bacterium]
MPQSPPPDERPAANPQDIVITVRGDGTVQLNAEQIDVARLHERLARIVETRGNNVIFVCGGKDLYFRQIAEVIDIAKGAGIDRVGLMTQPPPLPL